MGSRKPSLAAAPLETIVLDVPIRTKSEANARGHWKGRNRRSARARDGLAMAARASGAMCDDGCGELAINLPVDVLLIRVAPRELDDDNLRPALKACRDEVALLLGLPVKKLARGQKRAIAEDRDPRVSWNYGQERGKPRQYAVRVVINRRKGR